MIAVDFGPPGIAIRLADLDELIANDLGEPLGPRENVAQVADLLQQVLVLGDDLVLLEAR